MTRMRNPAIMFLKREIRIRIDLLIPNIKENFEHTIRKDV